jgi:hypothetical protein
MKLRHRVCWSLQSHIGGLRPVIARQGTVSRLPLWVGGRLIEQLIRLPDGFCSRHIDGHRRLAG